MSVEDEKRYVVIEPDAAAFIFTESASDSREAPDEDAPIPERIMQQLRDLLPTVKRIRPMEARLQSGKKLKVYAPPI